MQERGATSGAESERKEHADMVSFLIRDGASWFPVAQFDLGQTPRIGETVTLAADPAAESATFRVVNVTYCVYTDAPGEATIECYLEEA
jgi:hypothetical protein